LDWASGSDSGLEDPDSNTQTSVVAEPLRDSYRAAIDQASNEAFVLALTTLRGENQLFPTEAVLAVLEIAGWTDALREFKLQVLEHNGRSDGSEIECSGDSSVH
jgi:hypothetical protein